MIKWRKYTVIFIGCSLTAIFIYDVLAIANGGTESSISHTMIVWSYKYPAFTFLMGFVMGHLFWRVRETKELTEVTGGSSGNLSKD